MVSDPKCTSRSNGIPCWSNGESNSERGCVAIPAGLLDRLGGSYPKAGDYMLLDDVAGKVSFLREARMLNSTTHVDYYRRLKAR